MQSNKKCCIFKHYSAVKFTNFNKAVEQINDFLFLITDENTKRFIFGRLKIWSNQYSLNNHEVSENAALMMFFQFNNEWFLKYIRTLMNLTPLCRRHHTLTVVYLKDKSIRINFAQKDRSPKLYLVNPVTEIGASCVFLQIFCGDRRRSWINFKTKNYHFWVFFSLRLGGGQCFQLLFLSPKLAKSRSLIFLWGGVGVGLIGNFCS